MIGIFADKIPPTAFMKMRMQRARAIARAMIEERLKTPTTPTLSIGVAVVGPIEDDENPSAGDRPIKH